MNEPSPTGPLTHSHSGSSEHLVTQVSARSQLLPFQVHRQSPPSHSQATEPPLPELSPLPPALDPLPELVEEAESEAEAEIEKESEMLELLPP